MDKITELKKERAKLVKEQRNIIERAEEEGRSLEQQEENRFDSLEDDILELEDRISRLKSVREKEKEEVAAEAREENQHSGVTEDEYREAFVGWMRQGLKKLERDKAVKLREKRAQNVANATKGGYLVPTEWENRIIEKLREASVMRNLATVETTSTETNIPVSTSKPEFGWIDEEGSYPDAESKYGQKSVDAWKVGGIIKVSEELLYDNAYDLETRIEDDAVEGLREEEEEGFVVGDNVKKPRGFLLDAEVGVNAASSDAIAADEILDLVYSLKRPYRDDANFLFDDAVAKSIRKLKDENGQYLWQPSYQAGEPDRLAGYPTEFSFAMPEMTSGNKPVAFGDFGYYSIYDRLGMFMQRLDEKYADTGQVGFKVYRRTDGLLTLEEAVQTIEMA